MEFIEDQLKIYVYKCMQSYGINISSNIYSTLILLLYDIKSLNISYNDCWWTDLDHIIIDAYHITILESDGTTINARLMHNDLIIGSYIDEISVVIDHNEMMECNCLAIYTSLDKVFQKIHMPMADNNNKPKPFKISEIPRVDLYIKKINELVHKFWIIYGCDPKWLPLIPINNIYLTHNY